MLRTPGGCVVVQLAVIYVPWLQAILQTEALALSDLLSILVLSSSVLWSDELRKWLQRRQERRAMRLRPMNDRLV